MFNQNGNHSTVTPAARPRPFGTTVDPREAGRKGGKASGLARRLRPLRELEQGIIESRNGAAKAKLLDVKRRDEAALLEERYRLDDTVCRLMDEADFERKVIANLEARYAELKAEFTSKIEALEQREQELRERVETDAGLVEWLREVGEERVSQAAGVLGWIDDSEEPSGDVAS